ncbi:MAG: molybdopterin converting factor subunit 1 [Myxococcales bacterium]|nr:molybdopterin converting factor subunit 1 [Myxococcales bacterium]
MRIRVLYFAVVRERLKKDEELCELPAGATVADLLDQLSRCYPVVAGLRRHLQVARNRETARPDSPLCDGDEVALIPPVAGGADAAVRDAPLDLNEVVRQVAHEGAGGIVTFTGIVRRESQGKRVVRLEYEAYQAMAEERLRAITASLEQAHPGTRVAIVHRVGKLVVGDLAVVIAASAPHRAEAFAACRDAIERLKVEVPIWKKEIGEQGEEWVGLGP